MGTITTLRPSGTVSSWGWSAIGGTMHSVTSDDNDATYALWGGGGSELILSTPLDSPPAGERRHQARLRVRGEDGDAWWAVQLTGGVLIGGASAQFTSSPTTVTGSWGLGLPPDGSTVLVCYVTGQSAGVKITECYLDMDSREAPAFTPQVLDGTGTSTTLVADTAQPIIRANSVDLDDLNARQYRYWVTLNGAIVWDTGIVSGPSADRQTAALDNGTYVAHLMVWSTLGANTAYASDEETVTFDVTVGQVAAPNNPVVTQEPDTPFYTVNACVPYVGDLDEAVGFVEVQRVDCPVGGYLTLPGTLGSYASTPNPGPALTDLQVTVVAARDDDWRPASSETLAAHYDTASNQRSWRLNIDAVTGRPFLGWSSDGTSTLQLAEATERAPVDPFGVVRLRVSLDTDDGAGGWSVLFETRETDEAAWSQLGDVVDNAGAGTAPLFDASGIAYTVGAWFAAGVANERFEGRFYSLEVRDGAAGAIILNADFTDHLGGTRTFTDDAANVWTVQGSGAIYSPASVRTVAILGPLETDECAEFTDFTLPRSGIAVTCDHPGVECCSYYRARTVGREDGDLRISNWSDVYDPGIPRGVIMMWPSTAASLPAGWDRVTDLDGKYPKGVATAVTQPGATGGASTHTHTIPTHTHDTSHAHTVTGNTGTATGTASSNDGSAGNTAALPTHTHSRSALNSQAVASGSTSPTIGTAGNDPARLEVIFAESDGSPLGLPNSSLAFTRDSSLSGWGDYASGADRFVKGAAAAGDGGATAASSIGSHTHSISAHTHTGTSHTHTSPNTGAFASDKSLFAGAQALLWTISHSHPVTVGTSNSAALASGGADVSTAAGTNDPPYRNLRIQQNTSGDVSLPVGLICAWRGSIGSIPNNWSLCDGTDGTADLIGLYPRGATTGIESSGGSASGHTHTTPTHTHTTSGHVHTTTVGSAGAATANVSATAVVTVVTGTHTHSSSDANTTTPTVGSSNSGALQTQTSEPPYEEVAFIQLVSEPGPPPTPDTFCLTWSADEHLIRTNGPDGPMWAPIAGKFEWTVDRPFTVAMGVNGTRFVTTGAVGGRNLSMVAAVENETELDRLYQILSRPLVLISPSDAEEVWAAPIAQSVKVIKIGRIRQVTASFIGTGPEPVPQLADVAV